jgi:hypothetical protein
LTDPTERGADETIPSQNGKSESRQEKPQAGSEEENAVPAAAAAVVGSHSEDAEPIVSSELYDLIVAKSWHRAARLCQSNPSLAMYRSLASSFSSDAATTTTTCLFAACQNRPPVRIIQALLAADPNAARIECAADTSCDNASAGVAEESAGGQNQKNGKGGDNGIASINGSNSTSDKTNKELPLHVACRFNASLPVLQELLRAYPEASLSMGSTANNSNNTTYPIHELFLYRDTFENTLAPQNYRSVFWQKVQALLAAMGRTLASSSSDASSVLHVAALTGIPDVLDYALVESRHLHLSEHTPIVVPTIADRTGTNTTPLHVAIVQASSCAASSPASANALSNVTKLLQFDVGLAKVKDPTGRNPLHTAIDLLGGHPSVHSVALKLLQADPDSVTHVDPVTGLYPFQMAASGLATGAADVVDVEVVFRLLRTQPSVLTSRRCSMPAASAAPSSQDASSTVITMNAVRTEGKTDGSRRAENDEIKIHVAPAREPIVRTVSLIADAFPQTQIVEAMPGPDYCTEQKESPLSPSSTITHIEDPGPKPSVSADSIIVGSYPKDRPTPGHGDELSFEAEVGDHPARAASPTNQMPCKESCQSSSSPPSTASPSPQRRRSISLNDFLQASSPRSTKRPGVRTASSTDAAPALLVEEIQSSGSTAAGGLALSTDDDDDDDYDYSDYDEEKEDEGSLGKAAAEVSDDPIVRSINGMCSGALLLLTTMFHNNA